MWSSANDSKKFMTDKPETAWSNLIINNLSLEVSAVNYTTICIFHNGALRYLLQAVATAFPVVEV